MLVKLVELLYHAHIYLSSIVVYKIIPYIGLIKHNLHHLKLMLLSLMAYICA